MTYAKIVTMVLLLALVGCGGNGQTSPSAPAASSSGGFARRPICPSTRLTSPNDQRAIYTILRSLGPSNPFPSETGSIGITRANGVWYADVDWANPSENVTMRVIGRTNPDSPGTVQRDVTVGVRTGPMTVSACWDGDQTEAYWLILDQQNRAVTQDIRMTLVFPIDQLCGPRACYAAAPPGR